jgi:predicted nucleic acid-binding protein
MVLVDTSVWSLALRRKPSNLGARDQAHREALRELVREGRVQMIGLVRQEVLSGIRDEPVFRKIRDNLRAFDNAQLRAEDYEEAARMNNACRAQGIAGSPADFLICAVAYIRNWQIFTTDRDFSRYRKVLPLRLY